MVEVEGLKLAVKVLDFSGNVSQEVVSPAFAGKSGEERD